MALPEGMAHTIALAALAAALVALRVWLRPEKISRALHDAFGPLGFSRDFGPIAYVLIRWATALGLALVAAQLLGFTGAIRALLGAVGLVGLVVGFAGQHVIQNVLAGVTILLDGDIAIGDDLEVAGSRGRVVDIELRSTLIQQDDGVVLIVPNATLLGSIVKNRSLTAERLRTSPIGGGRG